MTSGAVSPFAIGSDAGNAVIVCRENALLANDIVNFHVLTKIATVSLKPEGLQTFLRDCRHSPMVFSLTA